MNGIDPSSRPRIRNVVLVGHGGTGKTTLAEALLRLRGGGDGRAGVFDYEPEEVEREHSLSMAVASLEWREHTINIIDTPGLPDAIGDAFPALSAADSAGNASPIASGNPGVSMMLIVCSRHSSDATAIDSECSRSISSGS